MQTSDNKVLYVGGFQLSKTCVETGCKREFRVPAMTARDHLRPPSSLFTTHLICGQWIERWPTCTSTIAKMLMNLAPMNSYRLKGRGFPDEISAQMTKLVSMSGTLQDCLTSELRLISASASGSERTFTYPNTRRTFSAATSAMRRLDSLVTPATCGVRIRFSIP